MGPRRAGSVSGLRRPRRPGAASRSRLILRSPEVAAAAQPSESGRWAVLLAREGAGPQGEGGEA